MPTQYEIYLCRDTGERLMLLSEYFELQYQIVQHETGFCHIVVAGNFDPAYLRPDYKVAIWRRPEGGTLTLEDVYMIRYIRRFTTADGKRRCELVGANGNSILVDRMPRTSIGSSTKCWCGNSITGYADNVMKATVRYALTDFPTVPPCIQASYFGVAADTSQGASFKKTIKYRPLADECTARAQTSTGRGKTILWHVVALSETKYEFRTYLNQIGQDRSWPDGYNPILATVENGMMAEPEYIWDGIEARNCIHALGAYYSSPPEARMRATAEDKLMGARNALSKYSHRESFIDLGTSIDTSDSAMEEEALDALEESYAKENFTFTLQDTASMRYGRDWHFGDKITAFYADRYYTCRIRGVLLTKDAPDRPESVAVDMDIIPVTDPEITS